MQQLVILPHQRDAIENPKLQAKYPAKQKNYQSYFWPIQLDIAQA
jgi:hypothetical protein